MKKSLVPVFLQILHVEDTRTYTGGTMVCNVTFMDGQCMCMDNLPIRLSSAGMVDEEAAVQFVSNLVDNLYLEGREGGEVETWVLKIKEN
ncbi:hypothetical protein EON65_53680 [archaeon]|nr:MAG: hypothetical protein EON65_53680 [archaeon]